jgi:3',5'-cyclic AMP phosphodiesterase CpdA
LRFARYQKEHAVTLDRRTFLKSAALTAAATLSPKLALSANTSAPSHFDFAFFTDTHVQPELDAGKGCAMCFRKIANLNLDFAIMGGDHVFDAVSVDRARANTVFDLYQKTQSTLQLPLHHVIGNHDVFGVNTASGASPSDPGYAKKMYEDRFGKTYYSFDHKGWHFILLDSIQPTEDRLWDARIDPTQFAWLKDDLQRTGATAPIIVTVHVPLVSAYATWGQPVTPGQKYSTLTIGNSIEVLPVFEGRNVVAVLQGHLHINEIVTLRNTQYITGGAVCGNWWKGPRMGVPEGFTVVSAHNGAISTRYESYGFKAVAAPEKS